MTTKLGVIIAGARARSSSFAVGCSLAVVAVGSGFISYTHISALTQQLGGSWKTAHIMPLVVDGQIVIGSVYLMETEGRKRWLGLIGIVPGIGESLYANWESGVAHGIQSAVWATVAAQAFACSSILFERWLKNRRRAAAARRGDAELLAAALADIAGLREALAVSAVLADAAIAVTARMASTPRQPAERPASRRAPRTQTPPAPRPAAPEPRDAQRPAAGFSLGRPLSAAGVIAVPLGPSEPLWPAAPARPVLVPSAAGADARLPLPAGEAELAALVRATKRNALFRDYQVSKHRADQLKRQYQSQEADENVA
jgi:hypothetical protein